MTAQLEISVEGRLGIIALNRPEAINALSAGMIAGISETLARWRSDDEISAVLFEGRGTRGFCAGGDVRAVRTMVLAGRHAEAEAYFAAEYAMNALICNYEKPVIALTDGIVMGGGIGIAGHADFRFTTSTAKFAMPEAAIGFVSDIGINALLARAPRHRALLFLTSGLPVGAGDALTLGLTDCVVPPDRVAAVREGLVGAASAPSVEAALVRAMHLYAVEPEEAALCALADRLEPDLDGDDPADMLADIEEAGEAIPAVASLAATLRSRCPTSLAAIVASHTEARRLRSIEPILALDLRMARFMAGRGDFVEGVRAVLVDKDHAPRWEPSEFAGVPREAIAKAVAAGPQATEVGAEQQG